MPASIMLRLTAPRNAFKDEALVYVGGPDNPGNEGDKPPGSPNSGFRCVSCKIVEGLQKLEPPQWAFSWSCGQAVSGPKG
jgi:hypothetical protein